MRVPLSLAPRALLLLALLSARALASEPPPTPEARVHFKAGVAALEGAQWQTAYDEFESAYAITPRWTILGNLGVAAWHLERDGEAIDAMEQYLARGGAEISRVEASKVRSTISRLQAAAATLTIEASGEFRLVDTRTGERTVVNEYGPFRDRAQLRLRPGQHTLELKIEPAGRNVPAWSAALAAGEVKAVSFVIPQPAAPPVPKKVEPHNVVQPNRVEPSVIEPSTIEPNPDSAEPAPIASYALWGAGAALGIATSGFVLHARGIQREADRDFARQCPRGATGAPGCERTTEGSERAASWRTAALGTGLGALGVLVTGTVLYFLPDSPSDEERAAGANVQPWIEGGTVGVRGRF